MSLTILLNPSNCDKYCQYAASLLLNFVNHYGQLYGQDMLTYNVHGLVHLAEEVTRYGALNNILCFPFEDYLGQLKRLVHSPTLPLQQVIRRISERPDTTEGNDSNVQMRKLKRRHTSGPLPGNLQVTSEFLELHLDDFVVKTSLGDNCVQIGADIVLVRNFFRTNHIDCVLFDKFSVREEFFRYPLNSSTLDIFKVRNLSV